MTQFVYFLGRFHVLIVHLPIGILLLAALLEILRRRPRFAALEPALPVVWLLGAVSALVTLGIGYMHATEGGFDVGTLNLHRWSASALVLFAFGVWAVRAEWPRGYARAWPAAVVGVGALLTLTGHFGGNLTHGPTYLAEYAPEPFRSWAGLPPELARRPQVTDLAEADIYLDVVGPALRDRCAGCHNEARKRGGLVLTSYDALMEGGEDGPVIAPGEPDDSDLLRRVRLPPEHVDHMPKNGKPPLSSDEVTAVAWWITVGAPREGLVGALSAPDDVRNAIVAQLGLASTVSNLETD